MRRTRRWRNNQLFVRYDKAYLIIHLRHLLALGSSILEKIGNEAEKKKGQAVVVRKEAARKVR